MAAYPKELTTDIPEHSFLTPADYWNERARGIGGTIDHPLGSNAEENALCHSNDRYLGEDITIHEFAHSLHLVGLSQVYPDFDAKLNKAYRSAKSSNIWGSHYGMTNKNEYWAEGVQSYFNANYADSQAPTDDRDQLKASDRNLYDLIDKYLGGNKWKWESCLDTILDIWYSCIFCFCVIKWLQIGYSHSHTSRSTTFILERHIHCFKMLFSQWNS